MSMSQFFSLAAAVYIAPHLSRRSAVWVVSACLLWSVIGPFVVEWMSQ